MIWPSGAGAQSSGETRTIAETDCTAAKLGDSIPVSAIGEPVSGVTLSVLHWNPPGRNPAAWCSVSGSMAPVDHAANAKPINFQVAFPSTWNGRAVQLGGGGMNGIIPMLAGGRYPNNCNGIAANVPIVGFSSLMLGPALIRIHEKPQANWVTAAKINAIRGEFMRQCDKLDGLVDGIINNYMACREIFD